NIFGNYFNNFTSTYINNILIFLFKSKKNYLVKVYKVIKRLIIVKLYLNPKKYGFTIKSIKYFNFIIIISVDI
ncbi:hypothetical protein NEUTE2DRAFT_71588, partial [Neurospora tetrasperma FGSC 2509]